MNNQDELIQYFLVNQDLKMKTGKIAAQVAHAATIYTLNLEKSGHFKQRLKFYEWFHSIQKKIILKAPQELLEKLEMIGCFVSIRDKGYTQILPNSLTCVTLGVKTRAEAKEIIPQIDELKLL